MSNRLGILLSGRGSNFEALADAIERGELPAEIGVVVSNRAAAEGIEKARRRALPVCLLPHREEPSRAAHEAKVLDALRAAGVAWICLAGYMRLLSPSFVRAFPTRIVNIHPSLLPAFPGLDAQAQALEYGVKQSGCTVHLVDEGLDSGPIVLQRTVDVLDDDTADSLAARILVEEHKAYPVAMCRLLTKPWRVEGRRVVFGAPPPRVETSVASGSADR